ncbi:hypothetical protein JCM11251_007298 [Rhodosporidiobolus azoricus]
MGLSRADVLAQHPFWLERLPVTLLLGLGALFLQTSPEQDQIFEYIANMHSGALVQKLEGEGWSGHAMVHLYPAGAIKFADACRHWCMQYKGKEYNVKVWQWMLSKDWGPTERLGQQLDEDHRRWFKAEYNPDKPDIEAVAAALTTDAGHQKMWREDQGIVRRQ